MHGKNINTLSTRDCSLLFSWIMSSLMLDTVTLPACAGMTEERGHKLLCPWKEKEGNHRGLPLVFYAISGLFPLRVLSFFLGALRGCFLQTYREVLLMLRMCFRTSRKYHESVPKHNLKSTRQCPILLFLFICLLF